VRDYALGLAGFPDAASRRHPSLVSLIDTHWLNDAPSPSASPSRVITDSASSLNLHETSMEADRHEARSSLGSRSVLSPKRRNTSPVFGVGCDGWCRYDNNRRATVVSAILAWRLADDINDTFTSPTGPRYLLRRAPIRSVLGKVHGVRSLPCYAASLVSASSSKMAFHVRYEPVITDIDWSQRNTLTHHTAH